MIEHGENGQLYKYCDWCNRYYAKGGVDTWGHNFCTEKCKYAYDRAHGTVDGGYEEGSFGHKMHKATKNFEEFLIRLVTLLFIGAIALGVIVYIIALIKQKV